MKPDLIPHPRSSLRTLQQCTLAILLIASASPSAVAAVLVSSLTGTTGTFSVSSTDLANQGQSTLSSLTIDNPANALFGSSVSALNNGPVIYGGQDPSVTVNSLTPAANTVVTLTLDTSVNILGYDINSIVSLTGCGIGMGQPFAGQKFDIEYSLVGSGAFTLLSGDSGATVSQAFGTQGEVQVTVAPDNALPIATGVDQLRFTFYVGNPSSITGIYREIDVNGVATVPEPSTVATFIFGAGFFILLGRRHLKIDRKFSHR